MWLKKVATVTFMIGDAQKIAQPKTLFDIAWDMKTWVYNNAPRELLGQGSLKIEQDGFENGFTGTINWYVPPSGEPQMNDIPMYMQQYIQEELAPSGIQAKPHPKPDISNMTGRPVWRMDIVSNDTANIQSIPEVNMSNMKAEILLNMMGLKGQYAGNMSMNEFMTRLNAAKQRPVSMDAPDWQGVMNHFTGQQSQDDSGPQVINGPMDESVIHEAIRRLEQMLMFAQKHGFKEIGWC